MPHRIESPFSFRLAEKKTAIHGQKKRRLGMSWPLKRPTHPKRGADRYGLLSKSRSLLPAALKVRRRSKCFPAFGCMALIEVQNRKAFRNSPALSASLSATLLYK